MSTPKKPSAEHAVLNKITDPFVRAQEGMRIGKKLNDAGLIERSALQFVKNILIQPSETLKKLFEDANRDPFEAYFLALPKDEFSALVEQYAEILLQTGAVDKIFWTIRLAKKSTSEQTERQRLLKKLYEHAMSAMDKTANKWFILEILQYAKDSSDAQLLTRVRSFYEACVCRLRDPKTIDDLSKLEYLWNLNAVINPAESEMLSRLIVASSILSYQPCGNTIPRATAENTAEHIDIALEFALLLLNRAQRGEYLYNLLRHDECKKRSSTDRRMRQLASAYIAWNLAHSTDHSLASVLKCTEIIGSYGLRAKNFFHAATGRIELHLAAGRIELADKTAKLFKTRPTRAMIETAILKIEREMRAQLIKAESFSETILSPLTYKYSSSDGEVLESFSKAVALQERIDAVSRYGKSGLASLKELPQTNITQSTNGKFLVFEYAGTTFIRTYYKKNDSMHADINRGFRAEIRQAGFADYPEVQGGAYITMNQQEKVCVLSEQSGDYGECDKDLAKKILAEQFADWKIEIRK